MMKKQQTAKMYIKIRDNGLYKAQLSTLYFLNAQHRIRFFTNLQLAACSLELKG